MLQGASYRGTHARFRDFKRRGDLKVVDVKVVAHYNGGTLPRWKLVQQAICLVAQAHRVRAVWFHLVESLNVSTERNHPTGR